MPDSKIKNLSASIRQRLLNLAQERNDDFGLILTKFGLERMLFRLSKSKHRDAFILKGALLFELWTRERYRATRDADFLAKGDNSPERFIRIFQEISTIEVENDGLRFTPEFYEDENKVKQWKAFCNKNKPRVQEIEFKTIIERLISFLTPVMAFAFEEFNLEQFRAKIAQLSNDELTKFGRQLRRRLPNLSHPLNQCGTQSATRFA